MKTFFAVLILLAASHIAGAQTIDIVNSTPCNMNMNVAYADDACGDTYAFWTGTPSGTSIAAPPGAISISIGTSWVPAWSPTTPQWYRVDICDDCGSSCVSVGDPCLGTVPSSDVIIYGCGGTCAGMPVNIMYTPAAGLSNARVDIF